MLESYGKIPHLGTKDAADVLMGTVVIEEKFDGSQFTFGNVGGNLEMRSNGQQMNPDNVQAMFSIAADTAKRLFAEERIPEGVIIRGEAFWRPKHVNIQYDRIPVGGVMVFDVERAGENLSRIDKEEFVKGIGLEIAPALFVGPGADITTEKLNELLGTKSILGGTVIEGVVIKNYAMRTRDGKLMKAKVVNDANSDVRRPKIPRATTSLDEESIFTQIAETYSNEARWEKAVMKLREAEEITDDVKDIGNIIKFVVEDILTEAKNEMQSALFAWAWKRIGKHITKEIPGWYKQKLTENI